MTRKIISVFLTLILCLSLTLTVFAASDVNFVIDEVGHLTDGEIEELNELAAGIYEDRGVGIFFIYTTEEDLTEYDVDQVVGDIEDYYIMIENDSSWYTFMGGKGKTIDLDMEEELREIYDVAETYYGGVEDFLNAAAECFPVISDAPDESDRDDGEADEEVLVYDQAGLLSDTEAAALNEKLLEISEEYEAQIIIATIDTLDDGDIDGFVEDFYDDMEFGYGRDHDGVLLLVCMDPREYRILSNGFAADALEDEQIEAIGEAIASDLSDDEYTDAFDVFADQCDYYLDGYLNGFPFNSTENLAIALVIGLVAGVIVALVLKGQLKSVRKQNQANVYVKPGSMQITSSSDLFLYRDVTRTEKESSKSSDSDSSRNVGGGSF